MLVHYLRHCSSGERSLCVENFDNSEIDMIIYAMSNH